MGAPIFRLSANPLKTLLSLLLAVAFTGVGFFVVYEGPHASAIRRATDAVIGYSLIAVFGAGTLLLVATVLGRAVLRRPLLQVDREGWSWAISPFDPQRIAWSEIATIAIYQQRLPRGSSTYYLVVQAKEPYRLPWPRLRGVLARFYPSLQTAVMVLPLDLVFLRQTPARSEVLLQRIQSACAEELERHGVRLEPLIQER
jgi:hypothetical protein